MTTSSTLDPNQVRFGADGLVPVVAQDVADGRVLMIGYADVEALTATEATGLLHFHSRSRNRLWRKGETSGNELRVVELALDCDADAVLATVDPVGPTCHRGTRSCFDADTVPAASARESSPGSSPDARAGFGDLDVLWATIEERRRTRPAGSYTASLLDGGADAVGRKVIEEAAEVLLAAKDDATAQGRGADRTTTRAALAGETADLLYHVLVLMAERGVDPADALDVLRARRRP